MSSTTPNETIYIILPMCGKPYVAKDKIIKQDAIRNVLDVEQEIVGGRVQYLCKSQARQMKTIIHPLFVAKEPRWAMANRILQTNKEYKLLTNENGMITECANMAIIRRDANGNVMPYFGIVAIKIKEENMKLLDRDSILPYKNFLEEEEDSKKE